MYTYSPAFKWAAQANRGPDAHAGRAPRARGTIGAPWGTPGARVARFGVCVPRAPGHGAPLEEHVCVPHGRHEARRVVLAVRVGGAGPRASPTHARPPRRGSLRHFPGPGRACEGRSRAIGGTPGLPHGPHECRRMVLVVQAGGQWVPGGCPKFLQGFHRISNPKSPRGGLEVFFFFF